MKKLIILGASGSIGKQCIELLKNKSLDYELVGISIGENIKVLGDILSFFPSIKYVYLKNKNCISSLKEYYNDIIFYSEDDGFESFLECFVGGSITVLNALVGFIGVIPSLKSISLGFDLALANKESLVVAGELIKKELKKSKSKLMSVDSEHVAIEKCFEGQKRKNIKNLVLTCSGGPFLNLNYDELKTVNKDQALKHPTWSMGKKISIDSATLINKVFEIIEAHYLFSFPFEKIKVIIHPQSLVHSMIELCDGNYLLDLGINDMRIPISYALSYNKRIDIRINKKLDFSMLDLTFKEPNEFQSKVLSIAKKVLTKKGNYGCILNAANDFAVKKFLDGKISFIDIYRFIDLAFSNIKYIENPTLKDIILTHNNVEYYLSSLL